MMRAIDLNQLAEAISPATRLMNLALALTSRCPNAGFGHPFAQRFLADRYLVSFEQLLADKRRTKVDIVFADELQDKVANVIDDAIVRTSAARLVPESRGTIVLECPQ